MAEAISIPSPSVFLRNSPPPQAQDDLPPAPKAARRQGAAPKKAPVRKGSAATTVDRATKPKQSKSRNGMLLLFRKALELERVTISRR